MHLSSFFAVGGQYENPPTDFLSIVGQEISGLAKTSLLTAESWGMPYGIHTRGMPYGIHTVDFDFDFDSDSRSEPPGCRLPLPIKVHRLWRR